MRTRSSLCTWVVVRFKLDSKNRMDAIGPGTASVTGVAIVAGMMMMVITIITGLPRSLLVYF